MHHNLAPEEPLDSARCGVQKILKNAFRNLVKHNFTFW